MPRHVYAIATMDTKGDELAFVARCLRAAGVQVRTVDVSTSDQADADADVTRAELLGQAWQKGESDRGAAIQIMSDALTEYLCRAAAQDLVAGVIGIGGSGGTSLVTAAMRQLNIGLPKLMVSTVASGNTVPYVDCHDITMMHSVVDIAGLNAVSQKILANAAHAMAGMVSHAPPQRPTSPVIGMTMFGVTTPCVTMVRKHFESKGYDCLVFHATGTGGRAMENLVNSKLIEGVLDITTTEVADEIVGGVFPAGPARFDAMLRRGIPLVLSLGAVDMVNFGDLDSVPPQFRNRRLHIHNPQVTLMRTTPAENQQIARWIAAKLNRSTAPVSLVIPEQGVSALDAPDQPFHDPAADQALFTELEKQIHTSSRRTIVRAPYHINAPEFAKVLIEQYEHTRSLAS